MNATVTKVNFAGLAAEEAAAIHAAEAEAADFYGSIEKEETERARLAELRRICGLMWNSRNNAVSVANDALSATDLFTTVEKETILDVAEDLHYDAEPRKVTKALQFINKVSRLHKTMQSGYYFNNMPATELLEARAK